MDQNADVQRVESTEQFHYQRPVRSSRVRIRPLPTFTDRDHLMEIFDPYGKIVDVFIPRNQTEGGRYGSTIQAFIEFETVQDAQNAQDYMDDGLIDGKNITVQDAPRPVRRDRYSRDRGYNGRKRSRPGSRSRSRSRYGSDRRSYDRRDRSPHYHYHQNRGSSSHRRYDHRDRSNDYSSSRIGRARSPSSRDGYKRYRRDDEPRDRRFSSARSPQQHDVASHSYDSNDRFSRYNDRD